MYIAIMIVHVIVCVVLILVVLLQAGRGGGVTDMLGGQAQNMFGTQTSEFMVKATEICAVLFVVTSLSLGIMTTQKSKSLMERRRFSDTLKQVATTQKSVFPEKPAATATSETKSAVPAETAAPSTEQLVPSVPETKEAKAS